MSESLKAAAPTPPTIMGTHSKASTTETIRVWNAVKRHCRSDPNDFAMMEKMTLFTQIDHANRNTPPAAQAPRLLTG